jgi:DNA-binding LytR/AlgR family response regulator
LLLPARFERIHRSTIVDLAKVESFLTEPGSRYFVRLSDGTRLAVSRGKVADLRSRWD